MQTFVSVFLFFSVFVFCWYVTGFEITKIELSKWGESGKIGMIWNSILVLLASSIFLNNFLYIKHSNRIKYKNISYVIFGFVSLFLLLVGLFNVNYPIIHNTFAWLYFFTYPLIIFIFTHINRKSLKYREWIGNLLISVGMIVFPLISILVFSGAAISEIIHILFVIFWNLKIALKII
jgi:hypothetical membrane protein